jgi:hypothetical protein
VAFARGVMAWPAAPWIPGYDERVERTSTWKSDEVSLAKSADGTTQKRLGPPQTSHSVDSLKAYER